MMTSVTITFYQVLPGKKIKVITKAALAKRALKKSIQVNTKVVFDEEGEVSLVYFKLLMEVM